MNLKTTDYYKNLSLYQRSIVDLIIDGCKVDCTEGKNYKVWVVLKTGIKKYIRKDSASIIFSSKSHQYFSFDNSGITLK